WVERGAAADGGEHGAVLRTDIVEPVGEAKASGPLHVPGDDGRAARDVPAEVTGQHARIEIVGAANAVADVELDVAALVEFRRRLRMCRWLRERQRRKCEEHGRAAPGPSANTHRATPRTSPLRLLAGFESRRVLHLIEPVVAHLLDH